MKTNLALKASIASNIVLIAALLASLVSLFIVRSQPTMEAPSDIKVGVTNCSGCEVNGTGQGSAGAAAELSAIHLGKVFTIVTSSKVDGDRAVVHAGMLGRNCVITLVKHPTANASGWVIKHQECAIT